jgi:hypothetical protein
VRPNYGSTITIDLSLGTSFIILVNDNAAFALDNAINAGAGQKFTIQIWNQTAGSIPPPKWGAGYKLASWAQPVSDSHRCIEFECNGNGTIFYEINRTTADIPN